MTAALEGGEWSAARPGRTLPPGKTRQPLYRRLGGPQFHNLSIFIKTHTQCTSGTHWIFESPIIWAEVHGNQKTRALKLQHQSTLLFLLLYQLDALISQIYFWNKNLHVSDSSSVHHQEFFLVNTAMVYVIQVCWQLASRIRTELQSWSCSQAVSKPLWHIPRLCVQWKTPDDGQRICLKNGEFYSKNKCEKSVHLVVFIIRI